MGQPRPNARGDIQAEALVWYPLNWLTPTTLNRGRPNGRLGECLEDLAARKASELYGPQGPAPTGVESTPTSGRRRLNPKFVEWLMGFPSEHTAANAKPDYEHWETQCHHLLPQWLGGSSCDEP